MTLKRRSLVVFDQVYVIFIDLANSGKLEFLQELHVMFKAADSARTNSFNGQHETAKEHGPGGGGGGESHVNIRGCSPVYLNLTPDGDQSGVSRALLGL